ncbi:hypothetical protein [Streptomyces mirabilis]|uniref:hypothetical protein n=1 Tax=Streptomyces mirabilis TaxID=68239 RepID=UPI0033D83A5E
MSYIRFQDRDGAAQLRGSERPWLYQFAHDTAAGVLLGQRASGAKAVRLRELLPMDHALQFVPAPGREDTLRWQHDYVRSLNPVLADTVAVYREHEIGMYPILLNTALVLGSDIVKLAARLFGQCESNCWVDGPHRAWLADIIDEALTGGAYRRDHGWEDVQALLQQRDDQPVVVSYAESFPQPWADWGRDLIGEDADASDVQAYWETLPVDDRWKAGMRRLTDSDARLELVPAWTRFRFQPGLSFLDLLADDRDARLERVFDTASVSS